MNPMSIDSQLLSAWADGELDPGTPDHAAVAAWLAEHPQDQARVRAWQADARALRSALAGELDEPVPMALRQLVMDGSGRSAARWLPRTGTAMAAAAAGLLVGGALLGGAIVWRLDRHDPELAAGTASGWVERAAYAHTVYAPEPRHPVEVRAQEEHLARWLTSRIRVPVKLFDLGAQGFQLVGGRLLPDGPDKSAQLMYQNATGQRITVYLRKPDSATDAAFRYEERDGLGLFYWVEAGAGYAVVGPLPRAQLLAIAEAIYHQNPPMPQGPGAASAPTS